MAEFHEFGVGTLLPTYDHRNAAGSGCLDATDEGLTPYGRDLVRELNAVGIVADGSALRRAERGLDLCECRPAGRLQPLLSARGLGAPRATSPDDPAPGVRRDRRVIGVTGVGIFLAPNEATMAALSPAHRPRGRTWWSGARRRFHRLLVRRGTCARGCDNPTCSRELQPVGNDRFHRAGGVPRRRAALRERAAGRRRAAAILGSDFRRVAAAAWAPRSRGTHAMPKKTVPFVPAGELR